MSQAAPDSPPPIEARGLTVTRPSGGRDLTILEGVDLTIGAGELVSVLGPSGSGKSTLLGLLAGLDRPTSGSVRLCGVELAGLGEDDLARLRRGRVGFVFQSFQLLGNLTARENVALPLELTGVADAAERTERTLAEVGLADRAHHYPAQLSGGEQQRVALARAFAAEPEVLFADEPTGNLDSETGERILELLLDLRARHGTTLVLVTHDEAVAARTDRELHLFGGRLVRDEARSPA
ncbi:ABC transporter ATP-binding protein [Engelhardtia mirabilis]|uniref:Putative ABC transporter ATP-binding protein n=1 Tax=Engelhardtia mirabilis TaxID=2528011 RepID=A0A518BDA8_9BACT|nr:putative ABC transporter ATP-binding protein [Planctomycetes bacterium Pla133]QDU99296.1 putative ABC transporter ATP-binding protein [Planctomycetes bacterium Pla86]